MRRIRTVAALAAVTVGTLLIAGAPTGSAATSPDHDRTPPRFDHMYVLMLENHSFSSVIGDPNAPYLNELARTYTTVDHYYGVTHPSMPNYIAFLGGDNFGVQDDNDQNITGLTKPNLVDQLEAKGVRWGAYLETLPANKLARFGPTLPDGTTAQLYAKKHNPFVLFTSVRTSTARMAKVKDYRALATDLASTTPPAFAWISPNQCNDMHGGIDTAIAGHPETPCPKAATKGDANDAALKRKADAFVKRAVQTIMGSRAWTTTSAIVIVTDENDVASNTRTGGWESTEGCCDSPYVAKGDPRISTSWPGGIYGGGIVPAVVLTGSGPTHRLDSTPYNHYSLLASLEEVFRLPKLGYAAKAGRDRFGLDVYNNGWQLR